MDRFTKWINDNVYFIQGDKYDIMCPAECEPWDVRRVMTRLAQYEDTNLTPPECAELAQAKADGRLVELPCKVGDTVWYIDYYESDPIEIVSGIVDGYLWFRSCGFALNVVWDKPIMGHFSYCRKEMPFSEICKTVFLTREQAEDALKRKDGAE